MKSDLKSDHNGWFYYKGALKESRLPWDFSIKYKLDGRDISAEELAGKSGRVEIWISVTPAEDAHPYFTDNYVLQVQVPVSLGSSSIIDSEGASVFVAGKTTTLTYTILPGSKAEFRVVLDSGSFEMDGINIAASKMGGFSLENTDEAVEGLGSLGEGMGRLVEGTTELKSGIEELAAGSRELAGGQVLLAERGRELAMGMEEFQAGAVRFETAASMLKSGSQELYDGLLQISANGEVVLGGYVQLAEALRMKIPSQEQIEGLKALVQQFESVNSSTEMSVDMSTDLSADPAADPAANPTGNPANSQEGNPAANPAAVQTGMMAKRLLEQIEGLQQLLQSLEALNEGLRQFTAGVGNSADGFSGLNSGIAQLADAAGGLSEGGAILAEGGREFSDGLVTLSGGMSELSRQLDEIPGYVKEIADGQASVKSGLDEALKAIEGLISGDDSLDEDRVVSFASPEKGVASSQQFLIRTQPIRLPDRKADKTIENREKSSFIEKLIALFRRK